MAREGHIYRLTLCIAVPVLFIFGCSRESYKKAADRDAYKIIDSKWKPKYGNKVNYKISDANGNEGELHIDVDTLSNKTLNLAEALAAATANNRNYQEQKESLYFSALDLSLERHKYSMNWFATIDSKYQNISEDESVSTGGNIGFSKLLSTGGSVTTGIAIDWSRFLTGDSRNSLGSVLYANITQPLWAGRMAILENLTQSERDVLYSIRNFNRYRQGFVVIIVDNYYRVLQAKEEVKNAQNNYDRRVESQKRLEMMAKAGRQKWVEVDQASQDVLTAKENLISTIDSYKLSLDEFKIVLAMPVDSNIVLDSNELHALEKLVATEPNYTIENSVETALLNRLDLANTADAIDDAVRKVEIAAENLGPKLDLKASASTPSKEKTDFENIQFQRGSYGVGIDADLPLDRYSQRNSYRTAVINLNKSKRDYDENVDNVKLEVRRTYRKVLESAENYKIQKNSLELAKKQVRNMDLLLEAGQASVRDLRDAQDSLFNAQNNLTKAMIDHAVARLNFFRDIGILQIKPDGMWEY